MKLATVYVVMNPRWLLFVKRLRSAVVASERGKAVFTALIGSLERAVKALREAVAPGELADIFLELPQEYEELRTGAPKSPVSPTVVQ